VRSFQAELHIHTVLSPCAEIEMLPPLIVDEALEKNLDLIAITDHNASANATAVIEAARNTGLVVLPGMELQTREEVHVLCLFDHLDQVKAWQAEVDRHLPPLDNDPAYFGEQLVVDETGDFIRKETRLLIVSTDMTIEAVFEGVKRLGGLAVPAHVDRKAFGLIPILGFVPPGLEVPALEVSRHMRVREASKILPQTTGFPLIQGGDAHRLDEILGANCFHMEAPTVAELNLALRSQAGRSVQVREIV
jgi:3',5'-nucleoside bisphosphate phosphatase